MRLHIIFDKNGDKVGDLDSMDYAIDKVSRIKDTDQELQVSVANELVIHCFRVLVKEGKIDKNDILFYNLSTDPNLTNPIRIDRIGALEFYPEGFLEEYTNILMRLI